MSIRHIISPQECQSVMVLVFYTADISQQRSNMNMPLLTYLYHFVDYLSPDHVIHMVIQGAWVHFHVCLPFFYKGKQLL